MQRILAITLLCILVLGSSITFAQQYAIDYTEDFSDYLRGWRVFGSGKVELTTEQARSGVKSLKMSQRTDGWHSAAFDLDPILADGGTYKFSVYIRLASELEDEVYGHFTIGQTFSDGTTEYKWMSDEVLVTNDEWVLIESEAYTFDAANTNNAFLYVEVSDPKVGYYLDDFRVVGNKQLQATYEQAFEKDIPPLKTVLGEYFHFGAATSPHFLNEQNIHAAFIANHYGMLVAGNSMKPDALQPAEGYFNWREADQFVEFAEKHDMLVRGHTLLWHAQVPNWFFLDPQDRTKPATSEQLVDRIEKHVKTVVGRYKGRIYSWDVVNEVLNDSGKIRGINDDSKWAAIVGDVDGDGHLSDYIELAFKFAREADPDVELIINDYGLESRGAKRTGMYNLVKHMLEKGVPVDGIGLQMHISIFGPTVEEIEESIELFASLKEYNPDFTVVVTEMDMSVYRWMEEKKDITPEILELQAQRYGEIFEVFRRQAAKGNLSSVVMWGIGDMDSWLVDHPIKGRGDAGLLFDRQMKAKPAYYGIIQQGKKWYVTKAEYKGALNLIEGKDQPIGNIKPGEYTRESLEQIFDISGLKQARLAKGFILEVYPEADAANPIFYIGDDTIFPFELADLGERIIIRENTAQNLSLNKPTNASHNSERASRAVDGEHMSSWSVREEPPYWLSVDLGKPHILTNWVVYHREAGGFNPTGLEGPFNTADFKLQISNDETTWVDVDIVEGNVSSKTERAIKPVEARYARLLITKPTSLENNREAMIYELEIYGFETD